MKHNTFNIGDAVFFYDFEGNNNGVVTSYLKAFMQPKPKFTPEQMAQCFQHVENPKGWKLPINAAIPDPEMNLECLEAAILFYQGCVPTFKKIGANLIVKSTGYNPSNR